MAPSVRGPVGEGPFPAAVLPEMEGFEAARVSDEGTGPIIPIPIYVPKGAAEEAPRIADVGGRPFSPTPSDISFVPVSEVNAPQQPEPLAAGPRREEISKQAEAKPEEPREEPRRPGGRLPPEAEEARAQEEAEKPSPQQLREERPEQDQRMRPEQAPEEKPILFAPPVLEQRPRTAEELPPEQTRGEERPRAKEEAEAPRMEPSVDSVVVPPPPVPHPRTDREFITKNTYLELRHPVDAGNFPKAVFVGDAGKLQRKSGATLVPSAEKHHTFEPRKKPRAWDFPTPGLEPFPHDVRRKTK
jgi:hypothetical protein